MKFSNWPKFAEGSWNYQMIPVYIKAVSVLPSAAKSSLNGSVFCH